MNQKTALIRAMKRRWLTALEAAQTVGVLALSQRCGELRRDGVCVVDEWIKTASGKRVKRYRISVPTRWTA